LIESREGPDSLRQLCLLLLGDDDDDDDDDEVDLKTTRDRVTSVFEQSRIFLALKPSSSCTKHSFLALI